MVLLDLLTQKFIRPKNLLLALLAVNIALWSALFSFGDQRLYLKVYDVGQGDALFIKAPSGKQVLVDGGPNGRVVEELSADLPFFDRDLDLVVLTHPHADHLVGLIEVLKRYQVKRALFNPASYATDEYQTFLKLVGEKEIPVWQGFAGDVFDLGRGASLKVLWPRSKADLEIFAEDNPNNTSLVLLLEYGDFRALLTGDAEAEVQELWQLEAPVTVVKIPHQGALDGLSVRLLQEVKPKLAVVSVGENRFGHPSEKVLGEYTLYGAEVKRTDKDGTITIVSDGKNWSIR